MRIGLVADTHGLVDPALGRVLAGCEAILHAGDVMGAHVVESLRAIAPVIAVRGNNDLDPWGRGLPEHVAHELDGVRVLVLHILGKPETPTRDARRAIERERPRVVVYGHSHVPAIVEREGILYVNPGSAGPRRFRLPRSAGVLETSATRLRVELSDLQFAGDPAIPAALEVGR